MRTTPIAAVFLACLALSGCGPAGVVANSVVKSAQGSSAEDLERDIKRRFASEPSLRDIKVSVAISNGWRDAYQTRYSVLLAGTIPSETMRSAAATAVRQVINAGDDAVIIADKMRVESR
ncbi:MAG: BON domain-containing protein [Rhodospirillaceae bacterium]|nr:BON domain-containing protein [Rhodospirillales bacterium]